MRFRTNDRKMWANRALEPPAPSKTWGIAPGFSPPRKKSGDAAPQISLRNTQLQLRDTQTNGSLHPDWIAGRPARDTRLKVGNKSLIGARSSR